MGYMNVGQVLLPVEAWEQRREGVVRAVVALMEFVPLAQVSEEAGDMIMALVEDLASAKKDELYEALVRSLGEYVSDGGDELDTD